MLRNQNKASNRKIVAHIEDFGSKILLKVERDFGKSEMDKRTKNIIYWVALSASKHNILIRSTPENVKSQE